MTEQHGDRSSANANVKAKAMTLFRELAGRVSMAEASTVLPIVHQHLVAHMLTYDVPVAELMKAFL